MYVGACQSAKDILDALVVRLFALLETQNVVYMTYLCADDLQYSKHLPLK